MPSNRSSFKSERRSLIDFQICPLANLIKILHSQITSPELFYRQPSSEYDSRVVNYDVLGFIRLATEISRVKIFYDYLLLCSEGSFVVFLIQSNYGAKALVYWSRMVTHNTKVMSSNPDTVSYLDGYLNIYVNILSFIFKDRKSMEKDGQLFLKKN